MRKTPNAVNSRERGREGERQVEKEGERLMIIEALRLVMVAVWNRADHNIFILFLSFFFLLSSFLFPRLISAVGDWMFTILWHMVWP